MAKKKPKAKWLAIVCAYRKEETGLQATIDSVAKSAGAGVKVFAVEDKDLSGPGANRHRGIEAAKGAEVICIIDAHMKFRGGVIRKMADRVRKEGGLLQPFCHHNPECSYSVNTVTGAAYYAGARVVYRAKDDRQYTALGCKWSRDKKPGPRGGIMGACYVFRRDWYYDVGQPLSVLTGWGCDESLLSIAAWMSGHTPEVINGHVAHLYRAKTPWKVTDREKENVWMSRLALIHCVVSDLTARQELDRWTRQSGLTAKPYVPTPEAERFRLALLKQPRSWREWRDQVCEPEEIDGKQKGMPNVAVNRKVTRARPRPNPMALRAGIRCPHCKTAHDTNLKVVNVYQNGNKRHICPVCRNPFMSFKARA